MFLQSLNWDPPDHDARPTPSKIDPALMFSYKYLPFGADSITRKVLAWGLVGGAEMNNTEWGKYVAEGRKGQLGGKRNK